ncbi:hypothetical protein TorRG33x02_351030, partial [Trema orientale]
MSSLPPPQLSPLFIDPSHHPITAIHDVPIDLLSTTRQTCHRWRDGLQRRVDMRG